MTKRVVITGMGVISPLGLDVPSLWAALLDGRSGVGPITLFETEGFDTTFAAEVKGFDPTAHLDRKEVRRMDRFVQFAATAALQAVGQARLQPQDMALEEFGVVIGSGIGGLTTLSEQFRVLAERGPGRISPFLVPMMITDMASGQVSILLGAKGPNWCTTSACSSGADAIGEAYEIIRRGDAPGVITGGSEAPITPIAVAAFNAARALSTRNDAPQQASRPFDAERDGFVLGEGAAILVLEDLERALSRGATVMAEVAGYGATADAFHITQPAEGGEGGARAMRIALKKAGLASEQIGYINAHGTSTPFNDKLETMAIKSVFGEAAYGTPISSTKSMHGHLLGAAGPIEAIACVMAIQNGVIPPTINLTNPDPECDLDYVPNKARKAKVEAALSNSFGFGGHNSCLVFRSPAGI
ncbi:MAG: beta-ketoacyl-ACP synthase II [Chloroflexi bacterium]|nr:beta-ketoacyl-ACP synthase II [Chloroflexota bacterium]